MENHVFIIVKKDDLFPVEVEYPWNFKVRYYNDPKYYTFMAYLIQLMRDVISPVSIYRGDVDNTDEHIEDYLGECIEDADLYRFIRENQHRVMQCAMYIAQREPFGIYERLDYQEHDRYSVKFTGIIHTTDYR